LNQTFINNKGVVSTKLNVIYHCDAMTLLKSLPDNSIDLIVTDPPYVGVVNAEWDKHNALTYKLVEEWYRVCKETASIYVWCGIGEKSRSLLDFIPILDSKFHFKDLITWKKQRGLGTRRGWLYTREEILWYVKNNKKFIWNESEQYSNEKRPWNVVKAGGQMANKSEFKRITNVWTDINEVGYGTSPKKFKEIRSKLKHITPKPVEAIERIIRLHTKEGDIVLDPFMGSGTTAIACINTGRNYIGCDIDEECYRISIDRISRHSQ
jgi:DNA modification methylase